MFNMSSKSINKISNSGMEIVKFSKGIQVQARNNRGTRYLNYKLLIRKIRWVFEQEEKENWVEAQRYDLIFKDILLRDMNRMDAMYNRDINYIRDLMCILSKDLWSISLAFQKYCGVNTNQISDTEGVPLIFLSSLMTLINPKIECKGGEKRIMEWLYNLLECCGKLAKLRSYIIWNSIAVIKVLKKRRRKVSLKRYMKNPLDAYCMLNSHEFYKGVTLEYFNKNLRNLIMKIFRKDMFSEICQKCKKRTCEPIRSICNHILCWRCIISVDEMLVIERSHSKVPDVNCDSLLDIASFMKTKIDSERDIPTNGDQTNSNLSTNFLKRIRNKPFKNCPVCYTRWSRNPESLQVENKFVRLCIQQYINTNSLTGIPDIDTIIQSSVSNVGFISSDDETDDELTLNDETIPILNINQVNESNNHVEEQNGGSQQPGSSSNTTLLPPFDNIFSMFSRPQSSTISTITSSNNSFDETISNPSNQSSSNSNLNSNSIFECGVNVHDVKCSMNSNNDFVISNTSHLMNHNEVNSLKNSGQYSKKTNYLSNEQLNSKIRRNFEQEWNIQQINDLDFNMLHKINNYLRYTRSSYSPNHSQNRSNVKKQSFNQLNYQNLSDYSYSWNSFNQFASYVDSFGINNFDHSNTNQNNGKSFHNHLNHTNGNSLTNKSFSSNYQSYINDNIWSNNYQNNNKSYCNFNYSGFNSNYNPDGNSSMNYNNNIHSNERLQGNFIPLNSNSYNYLKGDDLWNSPPTQNNGQKKGRVNNNNAMESCNNTELISNWNPFSNDHFINNNDFLQRIANNSLTSQYNLNDEIVSSDSKLLDLFRGLGV